MGGIEVDTDRKDSYCNCWQPWQQAAEIFTEGHYVIILVDLSENQFIWQKCLGSVFVLMIDENMQHTTIVLIRNMENLLPDFFFHPLRYLRLMHAWLFLVSAAF